MRSQLLVIPSSRDLSASSLLEVARADASPRRLTCRKNMTSAAQQYRTDCCSGDANMP